MSGLAIVWQQRAVMLDGLFATVEIVAVSTALAGVLGLAIFALIIRVRWLAPGLTALIDLMRCVPFMLFLYLIYYALPVWGIVVSSVAAGVWALTLYNAAYIAELLRAAWKQLDQEQVEAGVAFGFHGVKLLRRIILPPLLAIAMPSLGNQVIQIIKDSAFLEIITVQELTYAANEVQATYYVPLAAFVCAALGYWVLCLGVETGVRGVLRRAEGRR